MDKLFIEDIDVSGKKVIVRVDFNVPLKDGKVDNDKRIVSSLPTIKRLLENNAKIILMSHLGRPKGQVVEKLKMAPVAERLSELLDKKVLGLDDCIGTSVEDAVNNMANGDIVLLQNLRFYAEEEKNDAGFSASLGKLADLYINDAFGTAHRAHASTEGITKHIDTCASGYLLKKELDFLGGAIEKAEKPFVAILGGAKISGKIDVISALIDKVDKILIGGGMTYTFMKAKGLEIGTSLVEEDRLPLAKELIEKAGDKLVFAVDVVITDTLDYDGRKVGPTDTVEITGIPADKMALDIGPNTAKIYNDIIVNAKTVLWNGPMGVFEIEATSKGTFAVANALAEATKNGAITIVGGGDSASAIKKAGLSEKVSHVSTGGGASLEFLEGKQLPGVVALSDN